MRNSPRDDQRYYLRIGEGRFGLVDSSWKAPAPRHSAEVEQTGTTKKSGTLSMEERLSLIRMLWWLQTVRPHPSLPANGIRAGSDASKRKRKAKSG